MPLDPYEAYLQQALLDPMQATPGAQQAVMPGAAPVGPPGASTGAVDPAMMQQLLLQGGGGPQPPAYAHQAQWDPGNAAMQAGLYAPIDLGMAPGAPLPYGMPSVIPNIGNIWDPMWWGGGQGGGGSPAGAPAPAGPTGPTSTTGGRIRTGNATAEDLATYNDVRAGFTESEGQILDQQTNQAGPSGNRDKDERELK